MAMNDSLTKYGIGVIGRDIHYFLLVCTALLSIELTLQPSPDHYLRGEQHLYTGGRRVSTCLANSDAKIVQI